MAVAPTGAIYKALEFDGVSSRTYGVYITGEAVYNAPERDVEMIAIPGRNGSFALDKGRFENIEVSYPAGIFADAEPDFAEAVSEFRNFLCSRNGYVRLQDEYNPNEYRMAVYKSGLEVTPAQLKAGEFNIVFECKPQRWLTSGESEITVGEWSEWETESGPIVEIEASETDKIKSLSVALEPIQDLHGYDKPWSGGGGKNKLTPASTSGTNIDLKGVTATIASDGSITLNGTATDVGFIQVPISNPLAIKEYTATMFNTVAVANNAIQFSLRQQNVNNSAGGWFVPNTVGKTNTFTPTAEAHWWQIQIPNGAVLSNLKISPMLVEGSTAPTTYEPYSNICPISGRTECVTERTGVNLFDKTTALDGYIDYADGELRQSGNSNKSTDFIRVEEGLSYYVKSEQTAGMWGAWYDENKNYLSGVTRYANSVITAPTNAKYVRLTAMYYSSGNLDTFAVNYPSTDHDYHAYNGQSYTTDLGRTVYGGTLDVVSGGLVVDRAMVDLGTLNFNYDSSGKRWQITMPDIYNYPSKNGNLVAEKYVADITATTGDEGKMFTAGKGLYIYSTDGATAPSGNLVYPLATPQTYQLTPTEVALLKGTNNVWSDGDITLEYGQDPNVIVNPTLFETSPLIECKGTGNIYLNSDQITINNLPIGDVSLASAKSSSTDSVSSSFNIDNAALLNPGDTITVASGCSTEVSFSWASSVALQSITPTISGTLPGGQVYGSLLSTTSLKCTTTMGAATFAYGTSSYYESTVSVAFEYLQSGTTYTKTCTYKASCSYDGVNTITLSITNKTGASPFSFTSASACSLKAIKGTSTRLTTTDTIYIDLDIGEAYIINSGTITSINDIVSIPSRLPTLKPGTNTITYANTITNLKITPRWWKV